MKLKTALLFLLVASSCKKELKDLLVYQSVLQNGSDSLRVFNLLSIVPNKGYELYLNDSLKYGFGDILSGSGNTVTNLFKYCLPPFLSFSALSRTDNAVDARIALLKEQFLQGKLVRPVGLPSNQDVVWQGKIPVPELGSGTSNLFLFDSLGSVALRLVSSSPSIADPSPGKFKLRVVNFGYSLDKPIYSSRTTFSVSVSLPNRAVDDWQRIAFSTTTDYKEFGYNSYQFKITNDVSDTLLNNSGFGNDLTTAFYPKTYFEPKLRITAYYPEPSRSPLHYETTSAVRTPALVKLNNVSNYPFLPGGTYTLYVIGDIYTVQLERMSTTPQQLSKIQFVNASFSRPNVVMNASIGDKVNLPFGEYTNPKVVPAGEVQLDFSQDGQSFLKTTLNTIPLQNATIYLTEALNGVASVYVSNNVISGPDFTPGVVRGDGSGQLAFNNTEIAKVNLYNLCPDVGNINFVATDRLSFENLIISAKNGTSEIPFRASVSSSTGYDVLFSSKTLRVENPNPSAFSVHYSYSRPDSLVGKTIQTLSFPFFKPGTFSIALIGSVTTEDPAKRARLLIIPHSNYED